MKKEEVVNQYMYFGYLLPRNNPEWASHELISSNHFDYTLNGAISTFEKIFDNLVELFPKKKHIIPLSGGWDSRAILGALLEKVDKSNIETVTFGVPGQLDYDIGLKIANFYDIKANAVNLKTIEFTWEKILESVKNSPWTYVPDCYFNEYIRIKYSDSNSVIWSGFLGDPLTGSHLINGEKKVIINEFIKKQKRSSLVDTKYIDNWNNDLSNSNLKEILKIEEDDILDLIIRQSSCIGPIVLPIKRWVNFNQYICQETNGSTVIAPFANKEYIKYWLSAPRKYRENQELYLQMLKNKYPILFSLPSKANHGLASNINYKIHPKRLLNFIFSYLNTHAPWLNIKNNSFNNYLDYNELFRTRDDYKLVLNKANEYISKNNLLPKIDINKLIHQHNYKIKNNSNIFLLLIGLAANFSINYLDNN